MSKCYEREYIIFCYILMSMKLCWTLCKKDEIAQKTLPFRLLLLYHISLQELCVCRIKGQCMYITQRWGFNCKSSSHQLHVFDQMKYFVLTRSPLNVGIVISISYRSNAIFLTQGLLLILLEKLKKKKKQTNLYAVMMIHLQFYHDFLNCSSLAEIELIYSNAFIVI